MVWIYKCENDLYLLYMQGRQGNSIEKITDLSRKPRISNECISDLFFRFDNINQALFPLLCLELLIDSGEIIYNSNSRGVKKQPRVNIIKQLGI